MTADTIGRGALIGAVACFALSWLLHLAGFQDVGGALIPLAAVLAVLWLGVGIWNRAAADIREPGEGALGSARFATAGELRSKCGATGNGAPIPLGKLGGEALFHRTEKHVLMLVSTGGGKGVSYILPNLLSYTGSVFVTDPKGENATLSARFRSGLGQVCVLDPWGIAKGDAERYRTSFNPLDAIIDGDRRAVWSKAKALADAFGVVKQNDHWQNRSKQLLTALIAHVCTAENLGKPRDLVTVRELLMENFLPAAEQKPRASNLRKGEELRAPSPAVSTIEAMLSNPACDGAIAREASGIRNGADEEVAGVRATAQVATEFIDESFIRESLRGRAQTAGPNPAVFGPGGLDFQAWRRGVMSVYLCVPARAIRDYPNYVRLVTVAALDTMLEREEAPSSGSVQFILDELGYIGRLESVLTALGLGRSFGIQLWGVFQNIGMIRDDYGPNGVDSFWSNAGARIVFASQAETSDYVSRQTGGATVTTLSSSTSEGPQGTSSSESAGETGRPLLTPHEVTTRYAKDTGRALVFLDGLNVAAVERLAYYRDEPFASRASR